MADTLDRLIATLPVLPEVATRILSLDSDSDNFYEEVLTLASQDPVIATQFIKMANSAALASQTPVKTLSQAISRLGTSHVRELATSIALSSTFKASTALQKNLWYHSLLTALFSGDIAKLNKLMQRTPTSQACCTILA